MDEYYRQTFSTSSYTTGANALKSVIKSALSRNEKKRETLLARIEEAEDNDKDRICGELVTANIYKIKYGMQSVTVFDYYENVEREIALDPMLNPAQNAQKYYKKYNKKKKTVEMSLEMLDKTDEMIEYLDSLLLCVNQASSQNDLEEISKEMENSGILPKKNKKAVKTISKPRRYEVDGYVVLIGKNNVQNDELVKNSDGGYTWLHTQKIHGSHTVIQGKNVPIETIEKVARYSAFFSKASLSSNVPVDYTLIKYVKKPSGAMPGKVIYTNQQTVYVTPQNPDSPNK
jgi:predicted ribosome quality control (RQC) complex YloA/Tae2 family protein